MHPAPPPLTHTFHEDLARQIADLGFTRHAILSPVPHTLEHSHRLDAWLAEGRHGHMQYMAQHGDLRHHPDRLVPDAKSVIILCTDYYTPQDRLNPHWRLARYARHNDYHDVFRARLARLAAWIHLQTGRDVGTDWRAITDSAPLMERELAMIAGLGWIGKNTMLIHPQHGSFFLIAQLFVDLDLSAFDARALSPSPQPDRCGRCTRCLDVCPTRAIIAPGVIDARRCISYLTIELKGPIPIALRPLIGDHLFGCDLCQQVCPWTSKSATTSDPDFTPRPGYADLDLHDLMRLSAAQFNLIFKHSPIKRTKRRGLLRNAAVVMGNAADPRHIDLLCARLHIEPEPLVRGHIAWALGRLNPCDPVAQRPLHALRAAAYREPEPYVQQELALAIDACAP